jgi:hypothetical protein
MRGWSCHVAAAPLVRSRKIRARDDRARQTPQSGPEDQGHVQARYLSVSFSQSDMENHPGDPGCRFRPMPSGVTRHSSMPRGRSEIAWKSQAVPKDATDCPLRSRPRRRTVPKGLKSRCDSEDAIVQKAKPVTGLSACFVSPKNSTSVQSLLLLHN